MLVKPGDIRQLREAARDFAATETLKAELAQLRRNRKTLYLSAADLEPILKWKLRRQYGRQEALRQENPTSVCRAVTQAAFAVRAEDIDYELEVRVGILTALPGIGIGVASAILALTDPDRYCVIDFRGWRAAYGEERRSFTTNQYKRYRNDVARLARKLKWQVQEVDLAMWELDVRRSEGSA